MIYALCIISDEWIVESKRWFLFRNEYAMRAAAEDLAILLEGLEFPARILLWEFPARDGHESVLDQVRSEIEAIRGMI